MAAKQMVGARVPATWAEQIDQIATEKNCKSADIVREAIALYLDKPQLAKVLTHEQRITALESRLARLAQ